MAKAVPSSDGTVTAVTREYELMLRKTLVEAEDLFNQSDLGDNDDLEDVVEETADFVSRASGWCKETKDWVKEHPWQAGGRTACAGVAVAGVAFSCKAVAEQFQKGAAATQAVQAQSTCNSLRADIASKLTGGGELTTEMRQQLKTQGNLSDAMTADKKQIQAYLEGNGKESKNLDAHAKQKQEEHMKTTAGDVFSAIGAAVQMCISIALLTASIKQWQALFSADGKMAEWKARLKVLEDRKTEYRTKLQSLLSDMKSLLGKGTEDKDGNITMWIQIHALNSDIIRLSADFTNLRNEVVQAKGEAYGMYCSTGTAAVSGTVSTVNAWVNVASKANGWLIAAAVMQTIGTIAAGAGFAISRNTLQRLAEFEKDLDDSIKDVDKLVQEVGGVKEVVEEHYQRYKTVKATEISKRDQAMEDAKASEARAVALATAAKQREVRMMAIVEELQKGPTPEVMAKLAELQAEIAAAGGA